MPTLRDIKRRIVSVQKTQQITSAMRMVAAAKLRRATHAIGAARPYAQRMRDTLTEVAATQTDAEHPLLVPHEEVDCVEVVAISSDRGLAGAFNSNALKLAERVIAAKQVDAKVSIVALGRKAGEYFRRHRGSQLAHTEELSGWVSYEQAARIGARLSERYASGEVDEVVLVYNEFMSTMTQTPRNVSLLPIAAAEAAEGGEVPVPYSIEPSPEKLLATLVPKAVEVEIFRALLENQAGEHAARMTAMESATRNTEELIDKLTLQYNRARQAAITKELVEIVTGAQALEG